MAEDDSTETPPQVPTLDLLLVARYGLLISLTHLIPIPVIDWLAEGFLRRRLTRVQLKQAGVTARRKDVSMLGEGDAGGCLGLVWSLVTWPWKRALRYLLWVLLVKAMIDTFSDVVARAILVNEALVEGALPGDAVQVRAAMQRAGREVNTKPLERAVGIVYRSVRGEIWRLWRSSLSWMRSRIRRERSDEDVVDADEEALATPLENLSEALARAIWIPEVHQQLRERFKEELQAVHARAGESRESDEGDSDDGPR